MPKVSVIVPVYNTEKYLPACLDSVLDQSLRDLEIICVDDCSPDRCGEIIDEYAARDARVKTIHLQENRRQGYGRNLGMNRATGKYLYFLDSDDTIVPTALEELVQSADRENLDAVFFDGKTTFENEELKSIFAPPISLRKGVYREEACLGKNLLDEFIRQNEWTCYPQRTFWRREFLLEEGIRYPEACEHEDEFFTFAGLLAAKRARYVRKQLFTLRARENSVMTSEPAPKNFHGYLMNYYYMTEFVTERNLCVSGAQINIARMFERATTLYLKLKDAFELGESFRRLPDKTVYRYFMSYIMMEYGENGLYAMDPETLEHIRKYRVAYVYGVGLTALRVCRKLERHGVLIGGFLTKESKDAPTVLLGRSVSGIDEVNLPNDAVVVVATKVAFWEDARDLLEKRNVHCTFHRKM